MTCLVPNYIAALALDVPEEQLERCRGGCRHRTLRRRRRALGHRHSSGAGSAPPRASGRRALTSATGQCNAVFVAFRSSAHRHGIKLTDILHTLSLPMAQLDGDNGQTLILGPDRAGRMLEVVVLDRDTDDARVIHAMPMRAKFNRYLS